MGQKIKPLRTVLDTNVLVSALLFGGQPGRLRDLWGAGRLVPLVSRETFADFSKVLSYPKFRRTPTEIAALIENELLPFVEVIEAIKPAAGVCRDPHDDMFLALAASGHAAYLVTGDQDLLVLGAYEGCRVVRLAEFLETIPSV